MKECSVCQSCFPDSVESCPQDGQPVKLTLPIETVIQGRYRLEKRLGHGSISTVYLADDLLLGAQRAVKIITPDLVGNDSRISERFLREATATSAIQHPNIVAVIDSGMLNQVVPFIVMEFVSGPTLQDELSISGSLSPSAAFDYFSPIAAGLGAAHHLGIVHGDLKPRNILIEKDRPLGEAIKITDFGLSRMKSGQLYGPLALPKSSGMLRSPLYLAPEEWSDGESDSRADIYCLGIILYQMLAGDVPFKGRSTAAIMKHHLVTPPPPMAGSQRKISSELEAVVRHALEKNPAERPATVEDFAEELRIAIGAAKPSVGSARSSRKSVRRSLEPVPETSRHDQAARDEDQGGSGGAISRQQSVGEITLVNVAAFEKVNESPPIDLDQTIVLSIQQAEADDAGLTGMKVDLGTGDPGGNVPAFTKPGEIDLDMTILPGMLGYSAVKGSSEALESPVELHVDIEGDEQLLPDPEEVSITSGPRESAFASPTDQEEEPPKSVSPLLLAAGVILIILLVGIGIYYSRVPQ